MCAGLDWAEKVDICAEYGQDVTVILLLHHPYQPGVAVYVWNGVTVRTNEQQQTVDIKL